MAPFCRPGRASRAALLLALPLAALLGGATAGAQPAPPAGRPGLPPGAPPGPGGPPPPVAVTVTSAGPDTLAHPDLSGVWILNAKESDDLRPLLEELLKESGAGQGRAKVGVHAGTGEADRSPGGMGRGGGTGMGGGMGRGAGGGGMGGYPGGGAVGETGEESGERGVDVPFTPRSGEDPGDATARRSAAERLASGWQRLLIAQTDREVEVIDSREQRRVHVADGQRHEQQGRRGATGEVAHWQGDTLVVTIDAAGRPGMTQVFRLAPQERRLYLTVSLPPRNGLPGKVVKLVYAAA